MTLDLTGIILALFTFITYLVMLLILFKLKPRISGRLNGFFANFMVEILLLAILKLQNILENAEILIVPYSREGISFLVSLFLLFAVYNFYRCLAYFVNSDVKREKIKQNYRSYKKKLKKKIAKY